MAALVCGGTLCRCSFGSTNCALRVSGTVKGEGAALATIKDHTKANLSSFGMCASLTNPAVASATAAALGVLTPQPCVPVIAAPWSGGRSDIKVGGVPAITNVSTAACAYAGTIKIVRPSQSSVKA